MGKTIHIATIVGARPQFIKAAAVSRAGSASRADWKPFYGDGRAAEKICEIISRGQTQVPHGGKR